MTALSNYLRPNNMAAWYRLAGTNQRQASRILGITAVTLRRYERGAPVPLHVRLAMAAIIAGLEPFDTSRWHVSRAPTVTGQGTPTGEIR